MKRLLRLRLSLLLVELAAIPLAALPFADQIRAEWKRYSEPKRSGRARIEADLACAAPPMRPIIDRRSGDGWFQYVEGKTQNDFESTMMR